MNFKTYLIEMEVESEAKKDADELRQNIQGYIDNFPFNEKSLRGMVADIRRLIKSTDKSAHPVDNIKNFFDSLTTFSNELKDKTKADSKAFASHFMVLALLNGLVNNMEGSIAGYYFEYFIAGILSRSPEMSIIPQGNPAEDIIFDDGSKKIYIQTKLKKDKYFNIGNSNILRFFRGGETDGKEDFSREMYFITGIKNNNTLTVSVFDGTPIMLKWYKEIIQTGKKITKAKIENIEQDKISTFDINVDLMINQSIENTVGTVFNLFKSAHDFVLNLNRFFTNYDDKSKGKDLSKDVTSSYGNINPKLKDAGIK